ncbi:molybdopterin-binding protein [Methylobacterium sp. SyP6R]|uniref:molybdopterin-binding protein n=1 Tax=Methylobacterium sp. SyP6R TaxID=2718876 RepID=UPI001F389EA8|nr:molybdopterin-binding protein [Methylobacterium sp. SyP6R]MCF4125845.1 molybdopterin-binding protein [Methylobacterium sp. SyP6R]
MPVAEAVAALAALARPVAPVTASPDEAVGAAAARDVVVEAGRPAERIALRDGWAVSAAETTGASPYAPVRLARLPAWVEAGDALPPGADALLPPEALSADLLANAALSADLLANAALSADLLANAALSADLREIEAEAVAGEGTRAPGAELPPGTRILAAGERVTVLHAFALAADGFGQVAVRRPHWRLLVAEPDTLAPVLRAWIAARGGSAEIVARPAGADALAAAMRVPGADAVAVIGGTGPGRRDASAAALARAGRLHAHGIALRPGESAGFGEAAGRPVLLLPGRPDAALAAWLALGRPLMAALAGAVPDALLLLPLTRKVASVIGLAEAVFLRRGPAGAEPLGGAELPLHRLARADAVLLVPPAHEGYPAGTPVEVLPL